MSEFLDSIKRSITGMRQSMNQFYAANRVMVLGGLTVLSILLIVWARLGFTLQVSQFFAAAPLPPPATLTVQCNGTQAVLSWNVPAGSTANAIQKNVNNQGWKVVMEDATFTRTSVTDSFVPTTVYRHKSDPNVVSNLVQCPSSSPVPTATPTAQVCPANPPVALAASVNGTAVGLSWTAGSGVNFQQLRVGTNLAEVNSGCQSASTSCAVVENNLPATQATYAIASGKLTPSATYYWRVVGFSSSPLCYKDASGTFTTGAVATATPSPVPTLTPTPPAGCYYQEVQCFAAPCEPQLVCPSATPIDQLSCTPATQSVAIGQAATVQATGGVGASYQWSVEDQTQTGPSATFSFTTAGTKTVMVRTGSTEAGTPQATCQIVVAGAGMNLAVTGRNLSTAGAELTVVSLTPNQQVEVISRISNSQADAGILNNIIAKATLPNGLNYVPGSTSLNGSPVASDALVAEGIPVGSLDANQSVTIRFAARVNGAVFPEGQSQTVILVRASSDNASPITKSLNIVVNRSGGQVGNVQTGPGDAVLLAFLVSAAMTLLYVSYTHTSVFRRREASTIARTRDPMDFRS